MGLSQLHLLLPVADMPTQHSHKVPKQKFPWKPTATDHLKAFLLCMEFRSALQLTAGKFAGDTQPLYSQQSCHGLVDDVCLPLSALLLLLLLLLLLQPVLLMPLPQLPV